MISKTEEWILSVSLVAMSLLGVYQVATRYVFTSLAFTWVEELIRHLFIVITYIGAAVVTRKKGHPAVDAIAQILPSRVKDWHGVYTALCSLVFAAVAAYASWELVLKQKKIGIETVGTEIPLYIVSIPMLVGFCLMVLHSGRQLFAATKDGVSSAVESER